MAVNAAPAAVLRTVLAPVTLLNRHFSHTLRTQDADSALTLNLNEKYGPLERLPDQDDLRFLEHTPGFRPEMRHRLCYHRSRITGIYLRSLAADFRLLQSAGRCVALR